LTELIFYIPLDTKQVTSDTSSQAISWLSADKTKPNSTKANNTGIKWQKISK